MEIIDGYKWDFGPNDPIEYFDITKSYWLTGYKPINDIDGLDFDPDWFREDAINKLKTGKYSNTVYGSKTYKEFWNERFRRSEQGLIVNGYRVTGDNYFWLNYFRLKTSVGDSKKASSGRKLAFPMFLVFQYEYFHYVEMCEILKKDVGLLKARALGFSEIAASLCVRPFITTPNFRTIASAFAEKYLKPLLSKVWPQLDWLNEETEGAFRRVRMVKNTDMHKRASKKKKDGSEEGHMAEIEGIVADTPDKLRGDRVERLLFEEAGSDKVLKKKYIQSEALITVLGGDRVGTRIVWGTGGDSGPSLEGISDIILNPDSYNILKFRHNHTPDGKFILTGMFIPAYRMVLSLLDKRGWCDPVKAKEWWDKERTLKAADPKGLLIFKSEYCYTIEEALLQQGDNFFPREELAEQLAQIDIYKSVELPKRGFLTWEIDNSGQRTGKVKWRKDEENGNVYILEHPLTNEDGLEYKNLYVGGIDSIDIGSTDSAQKDEKKASDFCVVIKKRILGTSDPKYVAIYKDRPKDPREAYENAAKLLTYYFSKAVLESTRTTITTYFRDHKYLHLLMKRPRATMPDISKGNSNMYGTPATLKVIDHYRELIYDFCLDYSHTIAFKEMIEQFLNYSDEKKKFFDIVAAVGMAELGDEELSIRKPEPREPQGKVFRDIGWWTDSRGYKHHGIIPLNKEEENDRRRIKTSDSWLYKD